MTERLSDEKLSQIASDHGLGGPGVCDEDITALLGEVKRLRRIEAAAKEWLLCDRDLLTHHDGTCPHLDALADALDGDGGEAG